MTKVAIITGAAQGIGAVYAQALANEGAKVMIADILDGKPTASRISAQGGTADFMQTDVSDESSVAAMVDATVAKWGGVDILINNAAIWASLRAKPFEDISPEEWDKLMAVNVKGPFLCARAVVPHMRAGKYGRIVNIASIAGKEGNPNACAYSASKAGVIGFTKSLGKELADHDIAVNCVTPAAARTPIFDQMSQEHIDYMLSKIPRNRFLEVDEAARMIVWLASAENSFSTGAVFDLSGGRATY